MSVSQHTPGPWRISRRKIAERAVHYSEYFAIGPSAGPFFAILPTGKSSIAYIQEANANLIAAAPSLLAALELALPIVKASCEAHPGGLAESQAHPDGKAYVAMLDAIAEARGGRS